MLDWYNNKYANFSGRASRSEYGYYILIYFMVVFVICLLYWVTKNNLNLIFNLCIFQLVIFVPMQAVTIRRLKDLGMKWSFSLLIFLPFFNFLLMTYLLVFSGQRGENQYGDDPKMSSQIVDFN